MRKDIITTGNNELTLDDARAKAEKVFDLLDVRETTRADYKTRIGLFLDFTRRQGINRNSFLDFKRELTDRTDLSVSTKNKYLTTARVFLKELNRQGVLPADITQNIKTFRQSKKHKKDGLTDEEISALMEKIRPLPNTPQTTRLKAILVLLTLQGLRQIELIRLEVRDLDFVSKTAFIQGKGQDDKELINLHPETCKTLREYLRTNKIADGALFTSQSNNSRNRRLTTRAIRGIVKATLAELGINKTTHGFRHYFTTKLIKTYKGDLLEVAQYTRHKSLEMLQVYNDSIKREADLPRFYKAFDGVNF
ncbi:site-specific integrase [Candidatus Atribacteria bacterium 1244-E10-H5-B2]|nr:MAG: site-specific integrase [Candidatus Atribacteria bacterium 1244-E10-H5-B2]